MKIPTNEIINTTSAIRFIDLGIEFDRDVLIFEAGRLFAKMLLYDTDEEFYGFIDESLALFLDLKEYNL